MGNADEKRSAFNVVIVGQAGRLQYEAVLFAASLRHSDPDFAGKLIVAEPQPGDHWPKDPRMDPAPRAALEDLGAKIIPFESRHFGASYPQGNKIEGLWSLPDDKPFVFFDTDTLIIDRLSDVTFPFDRPSGSMRRECTWPTIELYGPGYAATWEALYRKFELDFQSTLDLNQPDEHWERYLYFNAGWFFHSDPAAFRDRFLKTALAIRDEPPDALICQELYPWLDQIALPLVIQSFGGGRPGPELDGLDGEVSCHYRLLPLLYARESDKVVEVLEQIAAPNRLKKVLKEYEPIKRMVYQKRGHKVRDLFDRDHLPSREQIIRNRIKRANLWMR